ncbi:MAG: hypothetical protein M0T74_06390 [Desulfitobacterium hafniense]|nr:hypothetical protein [Desulfosporosinus sp.]MDA8227325.1 hypothetical protein [Desulfitobacterium hafniense]
MKNKSTLVSLVLATGSVVALVIILGNLESPSSSPSTSNTVVAPASQGEVVSQDISYEYDFEDDDEHEGEDDNNHNGKRKNYRNQSLPSTAASSTSISSKTTTPTIPSSLDSTQIQQNPRQSNTQAS